MRLASFPSKETPYILVMPCRLVGDSLTAADIILEFPVEFSAVLPEIDLSKYPKVSAWREKIKQQAGYKKALRANGEYSVARLL